MTAAINSYARDELVAYFVQNLDGTRRWENILIKIDTSQNVDIDLGSVKIPLPLKAIRPFVGSFLLGAAARRFLRPSLRQLTRQDVGRIRQAVGRADLSDRVFAEKLRDRCVELEESHPPLSRWIRRQIALLDIFIAPPPEMTSDTVRAAIGLRQGLFQATAVLPVSPTAALNLAEQIIHDALRAAALATCSVFGGECQVSANLMIPIKADGHLGPYPSHSSAAASHARVEGLWRSMKVDRRLLVVGETKGAGHQGFWVPIASSSDGDELPGAPYAYRRMSPNAVFKDDLPPFVGFSEEIGEKWRQYMKEHFSERLFISIPLLVPDSARSGTGSMVAAVLNVNASPGMGDAWYRAYHEEWLNLAQGRVAQFAEIALYAFLIKANAERALGEGGSIQIDTGSTLWDRLAIADMMMLPGAKQ
jgi:hypothetical protein